MNAGTSLGAGLSLLFVCLTISVFGYVYVPKAELVPYYLWMLAFFPIVTIINTVVQFSSTALLSVHRKRFVERYELNWGGIVCTGFSFAMLILVFTMAAVSTFHVAALTDAQVRHNFVALPSPATLCPSTRELTAPTLALLRAPTDRSTHAATAQLAVENLTDTTPLSEQSNLLLRVVFAKIEEDPELWVATQEKKECCGWKFPHELASDECERTPRPACGAKILRHHMNFWGMFMGLSYALAIVHSVTLVIQFAIFRWTSEPPPQERPGKRGKINVQVSCARSSGRAHRGSEEQRTVSRCFETAHSHTPLYSPSPPTSLPPIAHNIAHIHGRVRCCAC